MTPKRKSPSKTTWSPHGGLLLPSRFSGHRHSKKFTKSWLANVNLSKCNLLACCSGTDSCFQLDTGTLPLSGTPSGTWPSGYSVSLNVSGDCSGECYTGVCPNCNANAGFTLDLTIDWSSTSPGCSLNFETYACISLTSGAFEGCFVGGDDHIYNDGTCSAALILDVTTGGSVTISLSGGDVSNEADAQCEFAVGRCDC